MNTIEYWAYCIASLAVALLIACALGLIFFDVVYLFLSKYWTRICAAGAVVSFITGGLLKQFGETETSQVWRGITLIICIVFVSILVIRLKWRVP